MMQREIVKNIALYYKAIPGMLQLLKQEREDLENEYNGLRGMESAGMPRGSSPGKPTETIGLLAAEKDIGGRIAEIEARERLLYEDVANIRACLDALNDKYKRLIQMRYVFGYSWVKTACKVSAPDSTTRRWEAKAITRFGEALEGLPDADGLVERASRART